MATVDLSSQFPVLVVPPTAVTLDGFRAWARSDSFPERGHIAFIGGKLIIDMSPERYETHLKIKTQIIYVITGIVEQNDMGDSYTDGGFITNFAAGVSNEPDAMFVSWETLEKGKLTPPTDIPQDGKHIELVGAPDWICEIVSDSSVEKDTSLLLDAYHQAGVKEYWLIDARAEEINFQLLVWTPDQYQSAENHDGWQMSPVFDRQFRLTRSRDRLNRWRYQLLHR